MTEFSAGSETQFEMVPLLQGGGGGGGEFTVLWVGPLHLSALQLMAHKHLVVGKPKL